MLFLFFFFYFLKMFVKVWKKLVRIQRMFLWGCAKGNSKFPRLVGMMFANLKIWGVNH